MKNLSLYTIRIAFALALFAWVAFPATASAQTGGEQISWDDDEDEEEVEDDGEGPGNFDEVLIRLNGEETSLEDNIVVQKNDTLDIQVRHLKPGSFVGIHMKKGGIKLKRKGFYANSLGQLDLEVRTGGKRLSGQAVLYYTPSNGKKKEREVTLKIE